MIVWLTTNYRDLMECGNCGSLWHVMLRFPLEYSGGHHLKEYSCLHCFEMPEDYRAHIHKAFRHGVIQCVEFFETYDEEGGRKLISTKVIMTVKTDD